MKAMLHKLPVRIFVYVLAIISVLLTAVSFGGLIVSNQVDEEQMRTNLYCRAGDAYSRDILSHITYEDGVPVYNPVDYPFMDYTIVYSNEVFTVGNASEKAEVLFSTKDMALTNLPHFSLGERVNGKYLSRGIVFGGDSVHHVYDLENLNADGYSYSEDMNYKNKTHVMIYFEIDPSVSPDGYKLMEDAYTYADIVGCLVSASIPTFVIAFAVMIISFVALVIGTDDRITFFEKIPFIIHLFAVGLIEMGFGALAVVIGDETFDFQDLSIPSAIVLGTIVAIAMVTVFLWTIVNYTRRIKAHKFYQTTLLCKVVQVVKKIVKFFAYDVSVTIKAIIGVVILSLIQLVVIGTLFGMPEFGLFLAVVYKIVAIALVIKVLADWKKIKVGSKRYATGDLSSDINTTKMIPELKSMLKILTALVMVFRLLLLTA